MRKLLFTLTIMTSLILSGQDIIPIPNDATSQWRISRGYGVGSCANWYNSIYYVDDTIVHNGKVFYKIFETGEFYQEVINPPGPCGETYYYTDEYRGAIRTENGKTYQLLGQEEHLLMDFTLNVGDTLFSYISAGLVIGSIDSVLVEAEYRKRFNFLNGDICNWMIEGIGHEAGLFEPMSLMLDFASEFHCYGENNIPLFGDDNCMLNVGYEELSTLDYNVSIHPNPVLAGNPIKIDNMSFVNDAWVDIEIFDMMGKKTASFTTTKGQDITIPAPEKPGIYLLSLSNSSNKKTTKLIVK